MKQCLSHHLHRESVSINSSLMTLGRCLEALKHNQMAQQLFQQQQTERGVGTAAAGAAGPVQGPGAGGGKAAAAGPELKVIPFRESKITHLFRWAHISAHR